MTYAATQWATDLNVAKVHDAIQTLRFMEGWSFEIQGYGGGGAALKINVNTFEPTAPEGRTIGVLISHQIPIPVGPMEQRDVEAFLFGCVVDVLRHEAGEWFRLEDRRPFEPPHGPGVNPYEIVQR